MSDLIRSVTFWFAVVAFVLLVAGLVASVVFWEWLHPKTLTTASNSETLRNVGLLIGGVLAFLFALWRGWVAERQAVAAQHQADTAQQSLLNERYERGAEMLGRDNLSVRLGGIYALKRLAEQHPEQYHIQVIELFCAFARNPAGRDFEEQETQLAKAGLEKVAPLLREDVQVIIATIGDRSKVGIELEKNTGKFQLDLRKADLSRAHLPSANLAHANLGGADLRGAYFCDANLSEVYLQGAKLIRANLINANLSGAQIGSADLSGVLAQGTDFSRANCVGANLSHADLQRANLTSVHIGISDLSDANLNDANLSGVVMGTGTRVTRSDPPISEKVFARLTQRQLDEACAFPDEPPQIATGTIDIETGKPLAWRGKSYQS